MGSERHERRIGRRTLGFAALAVIGCLVWGLPASAQASSSPVIESLSASNITQDNATVEAQVNPEGLETTFELFMPEDPCNVPMECIRVHVVLAQGSIPATAADESISIDLASKHVSMEAGEQYGFVIIAKNSAGTVEGHYSFRTLPKNTAPSEVVTGPAEPTPTGYKLEGRLNPDGLPTTYYYEYIGSDEIECLDMEPGLERCWHETAHVGPINGDTQQEVPPVEVTGLTAGVTYRYRLVASNADRTVWGNEASFRVGSEPSIVSESVSHVTERDATLEAQIDTEGLATSYQFHLWSICGGKGECQIVINYPLPSGNLLGSFVDQSVSLDLNTAGVTLQPGGQYFYSVTATSAGGTAGTPEGGRSFITPEAVVQPLGTTTSLPSVAGQPIVSGSDDQPAGSGGSSSPSVSGVRSPGLQVGKTTKLESLTKAQKLAKALTVCKRKPKKQRASCG